MQLCLKRYGSHSQWRHNRKEAYTQLFELAGTLIMTAGMALIYILYIGPTKARDIGAELLFGFGIGLCN
jgi:hypothetical protein